MAQEELRSLCQEWQKRLLLQDWRIDVRLVRAFDLSSDLQGSVAPMLVKRMAVIKVLDPVDHDPDCMVPQDPEVTLVHELLHLHFAPFQAQKEGNKKDAQEIVVDALATAFVTLKREATSGHIGIAATIQEQILDRPENAGKFALQNGQISI